MEIRKEFEFTETTETIKESNKAFGQVSWIKTRLEHTNSTECSSQTLSLRSYKNEEKASFNEKLYLTILLLTG